MVEQYYTAPCHQTLGVFEEGKIPTGDEYTMTQGDNSLSISAKKAFFRAMHTSDHFGFSSSRPKVTQTHQPTEVEVPFLPDRAVLPPIPA